MRVAAIILIGCLMGLSSVLGSGSLKGSKIAHREAILTHTVVINSIRNGSKCAHVLKTHIHNSSCSHWDGSVALS